MADTRNGQVAYWEDTIDLSCLGRLTLLAGTPVPASDQTAKTTILLTPYKGNLLTLFDGTTSVPRGYVFDELNAQIAVPSTRFRLLDVFAYPNANGVPALETLNWNQITAAITSATNAAPIVITSNGHGRSNGDVVFIADILGNTSANNKAWAVQNKTTNTFELAGSSANGAYSGGGNWFSVPNTRGVALTLEAGILVKTNDVSRRYLGTVMTTGVSGQTEDSLTKRLLYNHYNQHPRRLRVFPNTNHACSVATTREWNLGADADRVEFVLGVQEDSIPWTCNIGLTCSVAGSEGSGGVALDTVSTASEPAAGSGVTNRLFLSATGVFDAPSAGYHYSAIVQTGNANTITFRSAIQQFVVWM